jgi:hypothetical protein
LRLLLILSGFTKSNISSAQRLTGIHLTLLAIALQNVFVHKIILDSP